MGDEIDYWITTTIKWIHLEKILSGEKKIEYKVKKPFWDDRLGKAKRLIDEGKNIGINFVCKKRGYKYHLIEIESHDRDEPMDIDGIMTKEWYENHLGDRIS